MAGSELLDRLRMEQELARLSGEAARLAAAAIKTALDTGPENEPRELQDLKTQLNGLAGVAALAQDPREVEVYLRYQAARNPQWRAKGKDAEMRLVDAVAQQFAKGSPLLQMYAPTGCSHPQERAMRGIREFIGQLIRLYTYLHEDPEGTSGDEQRKQALKVRWEHVRQLAQ